MVDPREFERDSASSVTRSVETFHRPVQSFVAGFGLAQVI